jgi:hypothetical protein
LAPQLRPDATAKRSAAVAAGKRPAVVTAAGSARRMQTALAAAVNEEASWKEF